MQDRTLSPRAERDERVDDELDGVLRFLQSCRRAVLKFVFSLPAIVGGIPKAAAAVVHAVWHHVGGGTGVGGGGNNDAHAASPSSAGVIAGAASRARLVAA